MAEGVPEDQYDYAVEDDAADGVDIWHAFGAAAATTGLGIGGVDLAMGAALSTVLHSGTVLGRLPCSIVLRGSLPARRSRQTFHLVVRSSVVGGRG